MADYTTKYAKKLVKNQIIACKWEILAAERHLNDLLREDFPYIFDVDRANYIFNFFEKRLVHVKGVFAGTPIILDDWCKFYIGCIFGWVNKNTGERRFDTAYVRVARGNYKSTLQSGIALYGMTFDAIWVPGKINTRKFEEEPEVDCVAVDREQAGIVWGSARTMALKCPKILELLYVKANVIKNKKRGGELKKVSKDTNNKDGLSPCIIIVDEYHAHPTSLVKDVMSSGKGKRRQSLENIITTAGEDSLNKPCFTEDQIAKKILSGEIKDDHYFCVIYELDDNDDIHDTNLWQKANPSFRNKNSEYSKKLFEIVKSQYNTAYGSGDRSKIRQWLIKRANLWQADSENKYFTDCIKAWNNSIISDEKFYELTKGKNFYTGLDASRTTDLTGLGFVWNLGDGKYLIDGIGFLPQRLLEKHKKTDRVPYFEWKKEGFIKTTSSPVVDLFKVADFMEKQEKEFFKAKIIEFCYDPYQALHLANYLEDKNYICVEIRQGKRTLSEPTKKLKELLLEGNILHRDNPALLWCLSNAVEEIDSNENIKLSKKNSMSNQRIDIAAAIINAFSRCYNPKKKSIYETRGLLVL